MASTTPVAILSSLLLQIKLLHVKMTLELKWYNTAREWFNSLKLQACYFFFHLQIFPVLELNSLCKNVFLMSFGKFPVFSLSGKRDFQIPCFPCAVATLYIVWTQPIC